MTGHHGTMPKVDPFVHVVMAPVWTSLAGTWGQLTLDALHRHDPVDTVVKSARLAMSYALDAANWR